MQSRPQVIEIAISDIIVSALRHLKQIIFFGIICALVLGCWQGYIEFRKTQITPTSEALEEYERQLRDLNKTIERTNAGLADERQYINESLYMGLNPYGCYMCEINLSMDNIIVPQDMQFGQDVNPADYIAAKIGAQYMTFWDAFDLGPELGLAKYADVEDRYIRELLTVSCNLERITIKAYEKTESDARALAKAAMELLSSKTKDTVSVSYSHKLIQTAIDTKFLISEEIKAAQEKHYDNIDTYIDNISEAEESIKKLDAPDTPTKAVIKKAIIGGLVGVILACIYFVIRDIFKGIMQSAGQLSSYIRLDCLGNISDKKSGLYGKLMSSFAGEKKYANGNAALEYIVEMVGSAAANGKLLVSSTLAIPADDAKVQSLMTTLKSKGIDAVYGPSINTDPNSLEKLMRSDSLLLIENCGKTILKEGLEAKLLAEKFDKNVVGYVLV